jgi:hypothetical protein
LSGCSHAWADGEHGPEVAADRRVEEDSLAMGRQLAPLGEVAAGLEACLAAEGPPDRGDHERPAGPRHTIAVGSHVALRVRIEVIEDGEGQLTVSAWQSNLPARDSPRGSLARGLFLGIVAVIVIRIAWYVSVAVVGYPFIPARDDQAGRQHVVDEIVLGKLVDPSFVGFDRFQLSPLDADLAVGGKVEVERDARGVLTVTFWTQGGILGEIAGVAFRSDGQTPDVSDPDIAAHPLDGGWFALS